VTVTSWIPNLKTCLYNFENANHELGINTISNQTMSDAQSKFQTSCKYLVQGGQSVAGIGDEACSSATGAVVRKGVNLGIVILLNQTLPDPNGAFQKLLTLIASRLP
jgi:hypothetical protein